MKTRSAGLASLTVISIAFATFTACSGDDGSTNHNSGGAAGKGGSKSGSGGSAGSKATTGGSAGSTPSVAGTGGKTGEAGSGGSSAEAGASGAGGSSEGGSSGASGGSENQSGAGGLSGAAGSATAGQGGVAGSAGSSAGQGGSSGSSAGSGGVAGSGGAVSCKNPYQAYTQESLRAATQTGQCANDADVAVVCSNDILAIGGDCGFDCLGSKDRTACIQKCLQDKTDPSPSDDCTSCFTAGVECVIKNCALQCGFAPTSPECAACDKKAKCSAGVYQCTGLPEP